MTEIKSFVHSIPIDHKRLTDVETHLLTAGYRAVFAATIDDAQLRSEALHAVESAFHGLHDEIVTYGRGVHFRIWVRQAPDTVRPPASHEEDEGTHVDDHELQTSEAGATSTVPVPVVTSVDGNGPIEEQHEERPFDPGATSLDFADEDRHNTGDGSHDVEMHAETSPLGSTDPQHVAIDAFVVGNYPTSVPPSVPGEGTQTPSGRPPPLPRSTLADGRTTPSGPPSLMPSTEPPLREGTWRSPGTPDFSEKSDTPEPEGH